METHLIPPEVQAEAEAVLGLEMPQDLMSKAFQQWLQSLYEEDAGLAAQVVAHLKRKPRANPQGPLEQERQRLLRREALSDGWKRLWNVQNQYGEWVPNQKRRITAGVMGAMLAFGLLLWVMGQKPLQETKIEGSLGQIAAIGNSPSAQTTPLEKDSPLLPQTSDPVGVGATQSLASAGRSPGTLGQTPALSPGLSIGTDSSTQVHADFTPRMYPTARGGPGTPRETDRLGQNQIAMASRVLQPSSPIPSQTVPVVIRQPGSVLPLSQGVYPASGTSPRQATLEVFANPQPQAISWAGTVAPTALGQQRPPVVGILQNAVASSTPQPQAPTLSLSATPVNAISTFVAKPSSSALSYSEASSTGLAVAPPHSQISTFSVALSREGQGVQPGQVSALPGVSTKALGTLGYPSASQSGSAAYVKPHPQGLATAEPTNPPQSGQLVQLPQAGSPPAVPTNPAPAGAATSSNALPSLQTPTNLARDFLSGLDPAQPIEATLDANILLVEGLSALVRALTPDGTVWLGKASLDPLRRINIIFSEVIRGGQGIPVSAVAYDMEHNLGLAAEFRDENPSLVQDLLRQTAQAANGYLQSLLQSGSTSTLPGGTTLQDRSAPPLEWQLLGELGKLFTLPQPQNSFVRTARVNRGTLLLIYLQPSQSDPIK